MHRFSVEKVSEQKTLVDNPTAIRNRIAEGEVSDTENKSANIQVRIDFSFIQNFCERPACTEIYRQIERFATSFLTNLFSRTFSFRLPN